MRRHVLSGLIAAAGILVGACTPGGPTTSTTAPPRSTTTVVVNGEIVTVSGPAGSAVSAATEDLAALPPAPSGLSFPVGALGVTVSGLPTGSGAVVTVALQTPTDTVYKLINDVWDPFAFDGTTGAVLSGDGLSITLYLQDGGRGDADSVANGTIEDPLLLAAGRSDAQYWAQLYGAACVEHSGASLLSNLDGRIDTDASGNQHVRLVAPASGRQYRALIIRVDGATAVADGDPTEVYEPASAGVPYYGDDNKDIAWWIVCTEPAVPPVPACEVAPDFGIAGTTAVNPGLQSDIYDVVVDPQGRTIAVGSVKQNNDPRPELDTFITRLQPNGAIDPTFGDSGVVEVDLGDQEAGLKVAIDPLGRIVTTVNSSLNPEKHQFIVRLLEDGSFDQSFGSAGVVQFGTDDALLPLAIQPDARIIVGTQQALKRYNENGSLDLTFGSAGAATTAVRPSDLAVQGDGNVVSLGSTGNQMLLQRFLPNGSVDTAFGVNGTATSSFTNGYGTSVVLHADGRITAGGRDTAPLGVEMRQALFQVDANGSPRAGFGVNGHVTTDLGMYNTETELAIDPYDRIVAYSDVITVSPSLGYLADVGLARYNPDGTLDISCGGDGTTVTDLGRLEFSGSIALTPSGRILVGHLSATDTSRNTREMRITAFGG